MATVFKFDSCSWGDSLKDDLKSKGYSVNSKKLNCDNCDISPLLCTNENSQKTCIKGFVDIPQPDSKSNSNEQIKTFIQNYCKNEPTSSNCMYLE